MIVTCEKCRTRYRLDDARVSERGARVRCSRCKHAFHVLSAAERDQQMHAIASGVAAAESPFEDRPEPDGGAGPGAAGPAEAPGDLGATQEPGSPLGPEGGAPADREPEPVTGAGAERDAGAPESDAEASQDLFGFDIGGDLPGSEPLGDDTTQSEAGDAEDDWQFGDDLVPAAKEAPARASTSEAPLDADGAVGDLLQEKPGEPSTLDDLGDPESWDFLGDEGESPKAAFGGSGGAQVEEGLDLGGEIGAETGEARGTDAGAASLEMPSAPLQAFEVESDLAGGHSVRWLRAALHGLGWTVTLGLLAVIAYGSFIAPAGLRHQPARLAVDGLVAEGLHGRFIESRAGQVLYVVSGHLRPADGSAARDPFPETTGVSAAVSAAPAFSMPPFVADPSVTDAGSTGGDTTGAAGSSPDAFDNGPGRPASPLQVHLLDSHGTPIDGAHAWVGAALPESVLRETPPEVLREELARRAARLARSRPLPQSGVRFDAVFETLPQEAARFRLEVAPARALPRSSS